MKVYQFDDNAVGVIQELAYDLNLSPEDVIKTSLALLRWAYVQRKEEKNILVSVNDETNEEFEIQIPGFKNL